MRKRLFAAITGAVLVEPLLWSPLRGAVQDGLVEAVGAYGAYLGRPARLLRRQPASVQETADTRGALT
jgi:hypothetical protein